MLFSVNALSLQSDPRITFLFFWCRDWLDAEGFVLAEIRCHD